MPQLSTRYLNDLCNGKPSVTYDRFLNGTTRKGTPLRGLPAFVAHMRSVMKKNKVSATQLSDWSGYSHAHLRKVLAFENGLSREAFESYADTLLRNVLATENQVNALRKKLFE